MLSAEYWEPFEFELPTGTLVFRIEDTDIIRPTDFVRSEHQLSKWIRMSDRYTALVNQTLSNIHWHYGHGYIITEVMREYL